MDKREKAFWTAVGVVAAGRIWYSNGMRVPWKIYRQAGLAARRKYENNQALVMRTALKYEMLHPGTFSDEVLDEMEDTFADTMIDNDIMGVWNKIFRRKHGFLPDWDSVLDPESVEDDEDE